MNEIDRTLLSKIVDGQTKVEETLGELVKLSAVREEKDKAQQIVNNSIEERMVKLEACKPTIERVAKQHVRYDTAIQSIWSKSGWVVVVFIGASVAAYLGYDWTK